MVSNDNDLSIFCSKCGEVPLIKINPDKEVNIILKCLCHNNQTMGINEYLNLQKININSISTSSCDFLTCNEHQNRTFTHYCLTCNKHLCNKCNLSAHNLAKHQYLDLNAYYQSLKINGFMIECNKISYYINTYCFLIKENYIKYLKEKIIKVEEGYTQFKNINTSILSLLEIIYNNVPKKYLNYNQLNNFDMNSHITLRNIDINSKENILDYFVTTRISFDNIPDTSLIINRVPLLNVSQLNLLLSINIYECVNNIIKLQDGRFCLSGDNIYIYNSKTLKQELKLQGHTEQITYISQFENGLLISCSFDLSIKIWNIYIIGKMNCIHSIDNAHNSHIHKVIPITKSRFASCSKDCTICIWNENDYSKIKILKGHKNGVICIIQYKHLLISGDYFNSLRLWNLDNYSCETIFTSVYPRYSNSLFQVKEKLIVGGEKNIWIINLKNLVIEGTITDSKLRSIYSISELRDGSIVCGSGKYGNGFLDIIDIENFRIRDGRKVHHNMITAICNIDNTMFITSSTDKTLKVYKY